jgi:hypothetical protein
MRILAVFLGAVIGLGAIQHGCDLCFSCFLGVCSGFGIDYLC